MNYAIFQKKISKNFQKNFIFFENSTFFKNFISVLQFRGEDGIRKKMDAHYFSTLSTSWTFWTPVAFILYTGKFQHPLGFIVTQIKFPRFF